MTKILFIVSNLIIGGVEKVCWEIVSNLDKKEYHFDFLVAVEPDHKQYYDSVFESMGCTIIKGGAVIDNRTKRRFLEKERELIKQGHYDVVHSHMDFMNIWCLKVAKKGGYG